MRTPAAWWRMVRQRRPGIYAYRTREHTRPAVAEWGYVGLSNRLDLRDGQHQAKPWYDLVIRRYTVIRLPWWLGWRWVLAPLETLAILALLPRYNDSKNPRPGKARRSQQVIERAEREMLPAHVRAHDARSRFALWTIRFAGVACIVAGLGSTLWTR